ncbi:asparagine synthase (glutamine-hydrolyzing) [Kaistella jeonii]|uniref:asparagine synthase (glutamine-hydrolyzing) n=1 Tax=Kaistella jeonii TaxID=266749 RepID=A0A0C1D7Q8_9FLAO|nr:asparagine synthase (glutamine-hydrolyzing) [Kaistella jeonii]KIA89930.1 asparagine synthase [Kaistella jeonii]SFB80844.1 asparagine synthase (glutamine-hydrolysing) [Kaistella jeonii]VEI96182.1 Asparagine synthetase [glutamine-hydrolyzing] 1 [Kaistella jeonii]
MCGIAGIITPNAQQYKVALQQMTDAIAHRGPDAEHHEFFENAALGHRRLSIVDLSETGKQPMFSNTRNECIVLNGEIYGYLDLKKKYSDYTYNGSSDTEVILAMHEANGEELLAELPGMFAFAIWDDQKQELFCARDRFGEKPFYYAIGNKGEFIFGSEIKAILSSGLIEPKINKEALYHFLQYGYVSNYQSIYSNVYTLPPAHYLKYSEEKIEIKRYYSLPKNDIQITLSEAKEEFTHLLKNAVQKQLVADVEVGSFLSGGLDSSTIVAMVNEFKPKQTTISFGYSNEHSELKFAEEIAQKYQTNHIEIHENRGDIAADLLKISPYFDEPFSDMSYTPQFKICQAAARHLKVVLSGDVGDELFGGYNFYTIEQQLRNHFSYNNILLKFGLKQFGKFRETTFLTQQNIKYKNILDFHQNRVRNYFTPQEMARLGIASKFHQEYSFDINPNSLNDIMRVDLEKYVPGNMLVKSDRMAMANSLEVRTPFLDKNFAEFCIQLPENLKLDSQNDKIILRKTMQQYWTESIRNRTKQGFGSSVTNWFEEENLIHLSDDLLKNKDSTVFKLIDYNASQQFLNKDKKHWNLLQLALWAENHKNFI